MSAIILRFPRHAPSRRLRQRRKKIVRTDCAITYLFDPGSQEPGRTRFASPDSIDRRRVNFQQRGRLGVVQPFEAHPVSKCHAQEYVCHTDACQARFVSGGVDPSQAGIQTVSMPAKRVLKQKSQSPMPPSKRPLQAERQRRPTQLKAWRDFKNLTQVEVAEHLGIDGSQVSRIERGETPYDQDHIETFARIYGCEPWQLLVENPQDESWIYKFFLTLDAPIRAKLIALAKDYKP